MRNGDINTAIQALEEKIKPVFDFIKLDKAPVFYDLLSKRNCDDISELAQILQKRVETYDDNKILELHSILKLYWKQKPQTVNLYLV